VDTGVRAVPSFEAFGRYLRQLIRLRFGYKLHRWPSSLGSEQRAL
jgi:hypothetical protein